MRLGFVLALTLPLAACGATKDYQLRFHGDARMNPNSAGDPNPVKVKVMKLKAGAVPLFEGADFDALWSDPKKELKEDLAGTPDEFFLAPNSTPDPLKLLNVPDDVTHFGVVVKFNRLEQGKERLALPRAKVPGLQLRLEQYEIKAVEPGAAQPTQPVNKQGS